MNPITMQNSYNNIIAQVRNGKLNPRNEVLRVLGGLNPAQRAQVKRMLPAVGNLAQRLGIDTGALNEIDGHL